MLKWGGGTGYRSQSLAPLGAGSMGGSPMCWLSPPPPLSSPRPAPVSVTCGHAWLAVAVPAGLLGSRVAAGELTLGSGCGVTVVDGDGYRLEHPLGGCGTTLEVRGCGGVVLLGAGWEGVTPCPPRGGTAWDMPKPPWWGKEPHRGRVRRVLHGHPSPRVVTAPTRRVSSKAGPPTPPGSCRVPMAAPTGTTSPCAWGWAQGR